jgi:poly(A) polymerase
VLDYHHGVADLKAKLLRMIGDPVHRYREDPVRMLRAVRLSTKLGFSIDTATSTPIQEMASLIRNVPNARLFDEMMKLFNSGNAYEGLRMLRDQGLHHGCLPLLDLVFDNPDPKALDFVARALHSTDARIHAGKPVSAGFLFAAMLWSLVDTRWKQLHAQGAHLIPALNQAIDEVVDEQLDSLAIQRRYVADMREIWLMQPRFEKRQGASVNRLVQHIRFRAGLDFMLLRAESGQFDAALAQWWNEFASASSDGRAELMSLAVASSREGGAKKPRRRRRKPNAKPDEPTPGTE